MKRILSLLFVCVFFSCQNSTEKEVTDFTTLFEKSNGLSTVPIVALTAHAMQELRGKAISVGMDFYLTKPIQAEVLKDTLVKFLVPSKKKGRFT